MLTKVKTGALLLVVVSFISSIAAQEAAANQTEPAAQVC